MPANLRSRHITFLTVLAVLMLYQNCGQTSEDTTFNSASSYQESSPFAYDAKIDTLAYMSCSEMAEGSYEPRAYFTFRAGAYSSSTGGLGMTPAFRDYTKYYSNTDRANMLSQSSANNNTLLSLSVRKAHDFQSLFYVGSVLAGEALDAFLPALNSDEIAGPFAASATGQYINYFPGANDQRLMEASLRFTSFENTAVILRNGINFSGPDPLILVAGYSGSADTMDPALRSPFGVPILGQPAPAPTSTSNPANTTAYGVGYKIRFALPAGFLSGDNRAISPIMSSPSPGIQEIDLTTNQPRPSTWDCGLHGDGTVNYQFMVIRPQDLGVTVACRTGVDRFSNADQQAALNAIRRVLRVEDWFVDLDYHCIVPKRTPDLCYGTTLGNRVISYGLNQCIDDPTRACPHIVSVCIRQ